MILLPKDYLSVDIGMTLRDHKAKGVVMVTVTHTKRYQLGAFIPYTYMQDFSYAGDKQYSLVVHEFQQLRWQTPGHSLIPICSSFELTRAWLGAVQVTSGQYS